MRILMINYEYPPLGGGGGVASEVLAKEWVRQGHQVDVVTTHFKGLELQEERDGVNIYRVKVIGRKNLATATLQSLLTFPRFARKLIRKLYKKHKYDVINTHFAIPSGILGIWTSKKYKTKNVLSLHGGDIYDPTKKLSPHKIWFLRKAVKKVLNKSDVLVAQSNNTKDNTNRIYQCSDEIKIIPLAFIPPRVKKLTREQLKLKKDNFYLISVGRLVKRKGYEYLVKAMKGLPQNIHLILIGDGPEEENLKKLAGQYKVSDKIHFKGRLEDDLKFPYLENSDLYVLSSIHEGYGIVLQEAMEMKLPIVSTNYGGQTDFLNHEENALLINPGKSDEIHNAILEIYNNEGLRKQMAKNNKNKIQHFYADKIAIKYLNIFKKMD